MLDFTRMNAPSSEWLSAKTKVVIISLLLGVPAAMFLARVILAPVNVSAKSTRDDFVAAELRAELIRIYQKRHAYPRNLDRVWSDPEFQDILKLSFITDDRSAAFAYQSTGDTYEFRFTNSGKLVIERGAGGVPSREVVKLP